MSDPAANLRIRAQPSPRDPDAMRFLLDAPVQQGAGPASFDGPGADAPLARALFAVDGVRRVEVTGESIHVRKSPDAQWQDMKSPIAAAIRATLASTGSPLGAAKDATVGDGDAGILVAVRDLLEQRINPSIASHGGHIDAEDVVDGVVYLRMSGGCQGCAASQLTLRGGVERTLRAALPDLKGIVDVTDHQAGAKPFYAGAPATGAPLASPVAAPAKASPDPAPPLATRIREHLETLPPSSPIITYGALARALGLWRPGSVRRITRALEDTMREDAHADRPFIAARAVSRAKDGLPAKGFFDLARELARGPSKDDTERAFHSRELERLNSMGYERADP